MTLTSIITAYDALGTAAAATKAALATLTGYGSRPTFPANVLADADYNSVVTAQGTWDTNTATAQAAYLTALAAQKVAEASVTAILPKNQWVKCTGLANWVSATIQWISWPMVSVTSPNGCPLNTINSVSSQPALAYPSLT